MPPLLAFLNVIARISNVPRNTLTIVLNDHRMNPQAHGIIVEAFDPKVFIQDIVICIFPKRGMVLRV
jgi:hypothetical protein